MNDLTAAPNSTCVHCGTGIEREPNVGWVDSRSGDDGGTYDICPESESGHAPVAGWRRNDA